MKIIDVTGVGEGAVFLLRGKANILFEAGMAYAADAMIKKIREELDGQELDAVLLSHCPQRVAGGEGVCVRAGKGNPCKAGRSGNHPEAQQRGSRGLGAFLGQ